MCVYVYVLKTCACLRVQYIGLSMADERMHVSDTAKMPCLETTSQTSCVCMSACVCSCAEPTPTLGYHTTYSSLGCPRTTGKCSQVQQHPQQWPITGRYGHAKQKQQQQQHLSRGYCVRIVNTVHSAGALSCSSHSHRSHTLLFTRHCVLRWPCMCSENFKLNVRESSFLSVSPLTLIVPCMQLVSCPLSEQTVSTQLVLAGA